MQSPLSGCSLNNFWIIWVPFNSFNNGIIYGLIISRNEDIKKNKEKENIRGNINIFLLTLFAVAFLAVLLFMGYVEFINH